MKEADGKERSVEAGEQEDHGQVREEGLSWEIRGEWVSLPRQSDYPPPSAL